MPTWSERLVTMPPGRHTLPKDFVSAHQRERIVAATAELVAKRGYHGTSIELITRTARVSVSTFYELFETKEDCFVAAFDDAVDRARQEVFAVVDLQQPWPEQVSAGLWAFLDWVIANPSEARMCFVEAQGAGPVLLGRYEVALDSLVPKLREGRELAVGRKLPERAEEAVLGGMVWVLYQRIARGEFEGVKPLFPELLGIALRTYLDPAEVELLSAAQAEVAEEPVS